MVAESRYGWSSNDWDSLVDAGRRFLIERARLGQLTSYTEMNTVVSDRTGLRPFDFGLDRDRAAMGHLLYCIVEEDRPATGHMISALVKYLNENDAGPGFYRLAAEYGLLAESSTRDDRMAFWTSEVDAIQRYYRRRRR